MNLGVSFAITVRMDWMICDRQRAQVISHKCKHLQRHRWHRSENSDNSLPCTSVGWQLFFLCHLKFHLTKEVDDVLRIFMSRLTTLKYRCLESWSRKTIHCLYKCRAKEIYLICLPLFESRIFLNTFSWLQLLCRGFNLLFVQGETFRISVNGRVLAVCPYPAGSHLGSAFWTLHCASLPLGLIHVFISLVNEAAVNSSRAMKTPFSVFFCGRYSPPPCKAPFQKKIYEHTMIYVCF